MLSPETSADSSPVGDRLGYHQLHRLGRYGWQWSVVGVLVVLANVFAASIGTVLIVAGLAELLGATFDVDPVTPAGLAGINLVWAVSILAAFLAVGIVHVMPIGWVSSVAGRIRWRWLAVCVGLSLVALVATVAVSLLFPQQPGAEVGGAVNDWTSRTRDFVLVIVLLTPLQAAGEEYAFRGYLTQAFGGLVTGRAAAPVAVVVPAVLFALAHGAQSPPVFVDRLAFGLVAGTLTILTGGLEAGIAMHVLNNWAAFGLALAFGDLDASLTPDGGTWWTLPGTVTQSLVYLGLAVWVARATGQQTWVERPVLEAPGRPR